MADYDPPSMEERWQRAWYDAGIFEPKVEADRPKFMIIFAYPGISGFLHVGHMRGYSYCDAIARYERHKGKNVLFPAGFHASGLPAVAYARKVERGDEVTLGALAAEGVPSEIVEKLKDPAFVVQYFSKVYEDRYWRRFGFSIDFTRLACSTDAGYGRFIQWQFRRLNDKGLLVQKPHFAPFCPVSGPVAVDTSETDVSRGGDAEVLDFVALKFRTEEGVVFPCATLRPETVFGVTNLWVNPSVEYVLAEVGGERFVFSPEGARKANLLFEEGVRVIGRVPGRELVGKSLRAPVTGAAVRIFPSAFVDPAMATGVVMSVPAHAPYDFQALEELRANPGGANPEHVAAAQPIVIVSAGAPTPQGVSPAEAAVRARNVRSIADRQGLDRATEDVYTLEFRNGRMLDNTGACAGLTVAEARDNVVADVLASGDGAPFPAFSKEVVCRCGQQVFIKRIPDQWFIRYSDEALTRESADHARAMRLVPPDLAREFPDILAWFADRACIRQGQWLGTRFPLDENWIIEPISDSTLYPAFYLVAPYINRGELKEEGLCDAFFDFVFLGRGAPERIPGVDPKVAGALRRDFLYWYPLDINLGGKEHKTVHFPAFLKTHVALLAPEHWPRGIFVNWWVTQKAGAKLSKSKGGAEPIPDLARTFGVDAMRLYYAHVAAPWLDIEWDPEAAKEYRARLARIHQSVAAIAAGDLLSLGARADIPEPPTIDRWLASALQRRIVEAEEGWRIPDFRGVATPVYFGMLSDLRWYLRRGGRNLAALRAFARAWAVMMAPVTPHLAEELHHGLGAAGFVSVELMPKVELDRRDRPAEFAEDYLQAVLDDTQGIRQVAEAFARSKGTVEALERLAGKTVRGELMGRDSPATLPGSCEREVKRAGEEFPLVFGRGDASLSVLVQARRPASSDDVEKAARLASEGFPTWLVGLAGAPLSVRQQARELGVAFSGPGELDLLFAEAGRAAPAVQPKRVTLIAAESWKSALALLVVKDAISSGKADVGRLLKAAIADPRFKPHATDAAKVVQAAAKDASSRRSEGLKVRAEALERLDEYALLRDSRAFLSSEIGAEVEVLSGENPEASAQRLKGKAHAAAPLRPAIAIEY